MSTVNWSTPQMVNGRTRYACLCSCGFVRWLVKKDAAYVEAHQSPCYKCAQKIKAKKGFLASVAKKGWKWPMKHIQRRELEHPQEAEVRLYQILADLGLEYIPQYWLATRDTGRRQWVCLVDAMVVHNGRLLLAIEVNGGCHVLPKKQKAQKRKLSLLKRRGIRTLVFNNDELDTAAAIIAEELGLEVQA